MKIINLNRLLITTLIILFSGFTMTFANGSAQEENDELDNKNELYVNKVDIDDVFCLEADPTKVFIIIDQYDRIVTQGLCYDVMVKFFLRISDPLFEIDNTKYFRLGYDNPEIMEQRLALDRYDVNELMLP
jgi:hypothetical protein